MKKIIIASLSLLLCNTSLAQKKNSIEIGGGRYKFFDVIRQAWDPLLGTLDIKYKRSVNKRLGVYAQYTRLPIRSNILVQEEYGLVKESEGKLTARHKYNYFDLGVQYRVLEYAGHSLSVLTGLSLAYGKDEYLKSVLWTIPEPGEPYGHPIDWEKQHQKEDYWGSMVAVRYDYTFWKSRINLGAQFGARYYTSGFPFQINYDLHVGYNF